MNKPELAAVSSMPDVANRELLQPQVALDWVGMSQIHQPLLVKDGGAVKQVSTRQAGDTQGAEFIYQIGLRDRERSGELIERLQSVEGVTHVSLVVRDELSEV